MKSFDRIIVFVNLPVIIGRINNNLIRLSLFLVGLLFQLDFA